MTGEGLRDVFCRSLNEMKIVDIGIASLFPNAKL